jgi:hypothetical protein
VVVVVSVVIAGGTMGAAAAVLTGGAEDLEPEQAESTDRPGDPDGFVEAWLGGVTATYRLEGVVVRQRQDQTLELPLTLVERPPDYLRNQAGTIEQRLGDRLTTCSPAPGGHGGCLEQTTAAPTLDDLVDGHRRAMTGLVTGPDPAYQAVAEGDHCWLLVARHQARAEALGLQSRLCFDPGSGALIGRWTNLGPVIEELRVDRFSTEVSDGDLRLPGR